MTLVGRQLFALKKYEFKTLGFLVFCDLVLLLSA